MNVRRQLVWSWKAGKLLRLLPHATFPLTINHSCYMTPPRPLNWKARGLTWLVGGILCVATARLMCRFLVGVVAEAVALWLSTAGWLTERGQCEHAA